MTTATVIEADLTWTGSRFEPGVQVQLDADGTIQAVGQLGLAPTRRLTDHALLPGLVNAHSHAFQRGLRGAGERFPAGAGSFWTWREAMYDLVERMDAARLREVAELAFREMRAAGFTTVGEFHYLHHDEAEAGFAFDDVMLEAAAAAGIRIVLLNAYYRTGDIDTPLAGGQRRFAVASPDVYWRQMDTLAARLHRPTQTLGVVAHSIRAASIEDIAQLHAAANARGHVFHMHVEEQKREIEACWTRYGLTPMALLLDRLDVGPEFTAVHATHTTHEDLTRFLAAGGNVCLCPLTEANLGDGTADLPTLLGSPEQIAIGTDSNARLCGWEELRLLEYGQRLRTESRGVGRDHTGAVAAPLIAMATTGGARSLGLEAGAIRPGYAADFVTVDLRHRELAGWQAETLAESLVFGTGNGVVAETCVAGLWSASS